MGRRKLRACSNCGGRHGPPTGKACTRSEDVFLEKNEEMCADVVTASETVSETAAQGAANARQDGLDNPEISEWVLPDFPGPMSRQMRGEEKFSFTVNSAMDFDNMPQGGARRKQAPAKASANGGPRHKPAPVNMADVGWDYEPPRRVGLSQNERILSDRMVRLENTMGDLAAAQKDQMEKLMEMIRASLAQKKTAKPSDEPSAAGASAADDSDLSATGSNDDEEWADFFGAEVWKKEKDRIRKNPFDHRSYGKKGKEVETFEQLMVIQFKTMNQLLDLKYDVRGLVKHGLMMSEKAAKDVYEAEAFVQYDESVRSRAGVSGPTAFGSVDQEDVLRFFSCDNMKKKKQVVSQTKLGQPKKNKFCLRYNDSTCTAKNCQYAHRCIACEDWGHPKKECKNVTIKRKDTK